MRVNGRGGMGTRGGGYGGKLFGWEDGQVDGELGWVGRG